MIFEHWRHATLGALLARWGHGHRACAAFQRAFHCAPGIRQQAAAARMIGALQAEAGHWEDAASWLEKALKLQGAHPDTAFNLGFVRQQQGHHREALTAFATALAGKPGLDRAWYGKGLAHMALGEYGPATAALEEAARLQPMNGIAWYELGRAYHLAGAAEKLAPLIARLGDFEPTLARQLALETGSDTALAD